MKIRVISLAASFAVMLSATAAAVFLPGKVSLFRASSSSCAAVSSGYYMRDYNGKIGIFSAGSSSPKEVLDVSVSSLPEKDRQMLEAGIYLKNEEELLARIKDYSR